MESEGVIFLKKNLEEGNKFEFTAHGYTPNSPLYIYLMLYTKRFKLPWFGMLTHVTEIHMYIAPRDQSMECDLHMKKFRAEPKLKFNLSLHCIQINYSTFSNS